MRELKKKKIEWTGIWPGSYTTEDRLAGDKLLSNGERSRSRVVISGNYKARAVSLNHERRRRDPDKQQPRLSCNEGNSQATYV